VSDEFVVFFRHADLLRPLLKVLSGPEQVVVALRAARDEHVTLHREVDGTVLWTHRCPDLATSTWKETRVDAARAAGFRSPDHHGDYLVHRPLFREPITGWDGHVLLTRWVDLAEARPKARYRSDDNVVLVAPAREFMLSIHLSTEGQPFSQPDEPHVDTAFGALYFTGALRPQSTGSVTGQ
jgi:hypothetical protein